MFWFVHEKNKIIRDHATTLPHFRGKSKPQKIKEHGLAARGI
jgi:hypothetical protein